ISPGKANMGIIPGEITGPGPIGLLSRSGTLTYQVMYEMFTRGVGQSTCVGIGGDPIVGSNFIDILGRFQADDETQAIVLIGEIGGDEEEQAARFIADNVTKPVVAYIAGHTAPPGKRMGHAGAIISGSKGTAQAKKEAFESLGIKVGINPTEVAELAVKSL
ncbi:MAG TPA: succinate--CoA ligase subunit alpha, partial [Actinomycetota bacterium]|nr:succinate--CoA ligase subunit alpha [Actinomycetota bacterium]